MEIEEFLALTRDDQFGVIADQDRKAAIFNICRTSLRIGKILGGRLLRVLLRLPYPDVNDLDFKGVVFTEPAPFMSAPVVTKQGDAIFVTLPVELTTCPVEIVDWTIALELAHIELDHPTEGRTTEHHVAATNWARGWGFRPQAKG